MQENERPQYNTPPEHMTLEFELQIGGSRAKVRFQGNETHYAAAEHAFYQSALLHVQKVTEGALALANTEVRALPAAAPEGRMTPVHLLPGYESYQSTPAYIEPAVNSQPAISVAHQTMELSAPTGEPAIAYQTPVKKKFFGRWIFPWDLWKNPVLKDYKSPAQVWTERGIEVVSGLIIVYLVVTFYGPLITSNASKIIPSTSGTENAQPKPSPAASPKPSS